MKKIIVILILGTLLPSINYAQFTDQNWWIFGNTATVNFSSGSALGVNIPAVSLVSDEPSACYSDPVTGNLILYTNGQTVYRGDHSVISSALNGSPNSAGLASSSQGALILPKIGDPNKYYIFTTSDLTAGPCINYGLSYSIVDMALSGGTVISLNQPAVPMPAINPKTTEHLMAVPNCDETGYWIIVHSAQGGNHDKLMVFELTSSGLSAPVLFPSFTVTPWTPSMSTMVNGWLGFIKVSPDGKKIAISNMTETVYLYNFDKQTGIVTPASNIICPPFMSGGGWVYGLSFSPNSNQLYIAKESALYQYDVTNLSAPVQNPNVISWGGIQAHRLQLGPDDKIYTNNAYDLSVINYPDNVNNTSNAIGYTVNAVSLLGDYCGLSLPNVVDAKKTTPSVPVFTYTLNTCTEVAFNSPNCSASYTWNFGDGTIITTSNSAPVHVYTSAGSYVVTLTIGGIPTSQTIQILSTMPPISGPATWCAGTTATYSTGPFIGYSYNWSSATGTILTPNNLSSVDVNWSSLGANTIEVSVFQDGCVLNNSMGVDIVTPPTADAGSDVDACTMPTIGGSPSATGGLPPYTYLWSPALGLSSTTVANPVATPTTTTIYTLTVTDANGCSDVSTCTVTVGNDNWHQTTETTSGSEIYNDVITDHSGNVYGVGTYTKNTTLNGGGNPDMFISSGQTLTTNNGFVAKYNACGDLIWVANSTTFPGTTGIGIALDENSGMVYITGNFDQVMRFSSAASYNGLCTVANTLTIYTPGSNRGYVAQFDMNTGCLYFLAPLTLNTSSILESRAITVNQSTNDIYVGGQYKSASRICSFIVKYTPTTTMGTSNTLNPMVWNVVGDNSQLGYDRINDLDFHEATNRIYAIGDYSKAIKLTPGSIAYTGPLNDAFLAVYTDMGVTCTQGLFKKGGAAGTNAMYGEGIAIDNSNMLFFIGTYLGSVVNPFNLGTGIPSLSGVSTEAAYMIGFNMGTSTGGWSRNAVVAPPGKVFGKEVACLGGRVYFTGEFSKNSINIQGLVPALPFIGGFNATSPNYHVFTVRYTAFGTAPNANVTKSITSGNLDYHFARSITTDYFGHCFVVGQYSKEMDYFNGGTPPSAPLISSGGPNAYIMRTQQSTGEYKIATDEVVQTDTVQFLVEEATSLHVYPNPTSGMFVIEIKDFDSSAPGTFTLFNAMGQLIQQITTVNDKMQIDLSAFENGIYLLNYTNGKKSHTVRISKSN